MSNSLDPDQDESSVGPDLGPNCLQRLSADDNIALFTDVFTYTRVIKTCPKKIDHIRTVEFG